MVFGSHLELERDLLLRLVHHVDQLSRHLAVVVRHERVGRPRAPRAAGSAKSVHVVLDRHREVEVDHEFDIADI